LSYPADWKDIADGVKSRAGWRCERCNEPASAGAVAQTGDGLMHLR